MGGTPHYYNKEICMQVWMIDGCFCPNCGEELEAPGGTIFKEPETYTCYCGNTCDRKNTLFSPSDTYNHLKKARESYGIKTFEKKDFYWLGAKILENLASNMRDNFSEKIHEPDVKRFLKKYDEMSFVKIMNESLIGYNKTDGYSYHDESYKSLDEIPTYMIIYICSFYLNNLNIFYDKKEY